jgi:nucleoside-diphosphate-sugar epimerase
VHLAWFFQPSHRPIETWQTNVYGTERLLDAVARAGVRVLVYASSIGAYSPGYGRVVDESWPTHGRPDSAYGREKAYVERLLDSFAAEQPDVRVVRLRPGFLFARNAASEQWRIFAGPFAPRLRRWAVPVLPYPEGVRFNVLHTTDAAEACRLALYAPVRGAFNLAAEPVVDGALLADVLDARLLSVPPAGVRAALAVAWHLRLTPAEPGLFDLLRTAPLLCTDRARAELGWEPRATAVDALEALLSGLAAGAGAPTAPLVPDSIPARTRELAAGVGGRIAG